MQKSQHAVQWRREASVSMGEWTIVFKMKCGERYHCTTLVAANECVSRELVLKWVPASQTQRRPEIRIIVQQKLKHEIISARQGLSNGVCLIRICHIHVKRVPGKIESFWIWILASAGNRTSMTSRGWRSEPKHRSCAQFPKSIDLSICVLRKHISSQQTHAENTFFLFLVINYPWETIFNTK